MKASLLVILFSLFCLKITTCFFLLDDSIDIAPKKDRIKKRNPGGNSHFRKQRTYKISDFRDFRFQRFPEISRDFKGFPEISRYFQRFPEISRDFQRFPEISRDFQRFPEISRDFQRFPEYSVNHHFIDKKYYPRIWIGF